MSKPQAESSGLQKKVQPVEYMSDGRNRKPYFFLELKMPEELFDLFSWYLPLTGYWISGNTQQHALNALLVDILYEWMERESQHPVRAIDKLSAEFTARLNSGDAR